MRRRPFNVLPALLLLMCVVLAIAIGCERAPDIHAASSVPAVAPPTAWEPPAGGLDALFATIVSTGSDTRAQWEAGSAAQRLSFISTLRDEAEFRRVELDGTPPEERIICLNHQLPMKASNQTFYIAQKQNDGWVLVGQMEGEPAKTTDTPRAGMQDLDATLHLGGDDYLTTRYVFSDGKYVAAGSRRWRPAPEPGAAAP